MIHYMLRFACALTVLSLAFGLALACSSQKDDPESHLTAQSSSPNAERRLPADPFAAELNRLHQDPRVHWLEFERMGERFFASVVTPTEFDQDAADNAAVVLFSGRGEAEQGLKRSALAWTKDYQLLKALDHIESGSLSEDNFAEMVRWRSLEAYNRSLAEQRFGGLVFVSISTPTWSAFVERDAHREAAFQAFLTEDLPRRLQEDFGVDVNKIGVDGVSAGGVWSLVSGLNHPDVFASVGSLQPAMTGSEPGFLAMIEKRVSSPAPVYVATSRYDSLFENAVAIQQRFRDMRLNFDSYLLEGDHSYAFNRGPGVLHLMMWHHEALVRGRTTPFGGSWTPIPSGDGAYPSPPGVDLDELDAREAAAASGDPVPLP